jgi:intraflagellar transport protein 140
MRDFVGLDTVDQETRQALLDFSFHITVGNLDAAYRYTIIATAHEWSQALLLPRGAFLNRQLTERCRSSVRLIQSPSIWENMAQMCVKTRRLDVAELCLANMNHARGCACVRAAKSEPEARTTHRSTIPRAH